MGGHSLTSFWKDPSQTSDPLPGAHSSAPQPFVGLSPFEGSHSDSARLSMSPWALHQGQAASSVQLQGPPGAAPSDQGGRQEPPAAFCPTCLRWGGAGRRSSLWGEPITCMGRSALGVWPMQKARMAQDREQRAALSHHMEGWGAGGSLGTRGLGVGAAPGKARQPPPHWPDQALFRWPPRPAGPYVPRSLRSSPFSAEDNRAHSASGSTTPFIPGRGPPSCRGPALPADTGLLTTQGSPSASTLFRHW